MIGRLRTWVATALLVRKLAGAEARPRRAGYAVKVGRARMKVCADRVASEADRRALATWLTRIDRLLGGEQSVDVEWTLVRVTHRRGEHTELHWDGADGAVLFALVADALGASPTRVAAALARPSERTRSFRLALDPTASTL